MGGALPFTIVNKVMGLVAVRQSSLAAPGACGAVHPRCRETVDHVRGGVVTCDPSTRRQHSPVVMLSEVPPFNIKQMNFMAKQMAEWILCGTGEQTNDAVHLGEQVGIVEVETLYML